MDTGVGRAGGNCNDTFASDLSGPFEMHRVSKAKMRRICINNGHPPGVCLILQDLRRSEAVYKLKRMANAGRVLHIAIFVKEVSDDGDQEFICLGQTALAD